MALHMLGKDPVTDYIRYEYDVTAGHNIKAGEQEGVLRHRIGTEETMAEQLGHLLAVAAMPSVSLGVVPFSADRSGLWPVEDFWVFDQEQVNVELVSAFLTVTQPHEVEMYASTFSEMSKLAVYGATPAS